MKYAKSRKTTRKETTTNRGTYVWVKSIMENDKNNRVQHTVEETNRRVENQGVLEP